MRIDDGRWTCAACGEAVDMPLNAPWHTELSATTGEPNVRVIVTDGREVHRCALLPALPSR